jgi:hypothetical protein
VKRIAKAFTHPATHSAANISAPANAAGGGDLLTPCNTRSEINRIIQVPAKIGSWLEPHAIYQASHGETSGVASSRVFFMAAKR